MSLYKNVTLLSFFCAAGALAACGGGGPMSLPPATVSNPGTLALSTEASVRAQKVKYPAPTALPSPSPKPTATATAAGTTVRRGFVGAFFRPEGSVSFGVFATNSPQTAPQPYPTPGSVLFGSSGYCDAVASNGVSISTGYVVDAAKLSNIVNLGVKWTRSPAGQFFDDLSHVFGAGHYNFADFDSAQCALARHAIVPIVGLEAGPVEYNSTPGTISPVSVATYQTPADFATWCSVVATHEASTFPGVSRYSLPGNEVNGNPQLFPGGESQIAAYSKACYAAIKAVQPSSVVYGFELNMDGSLNAAGFVQDMYNLGCKPGTCYDAISMHLSLRYPIPAPGTPCYPNAGGDYSMQCVTDVQNATHAATHVLIGETAYFVTGSVPDETTKAAATVAAFNTFAADPLVDGVNYANVDECGLYTSGYFMGGCLVRTTGTLLPAYTALQSLAASVF
jgi:predicted small lipoprotein YifL